MRHEQAVELVEHRLRKWVISQLHRQTLTEQDLLKAPVTSRDIEDFFLLIEDYDWPQSWSDRRKLIAMYAANSEFQLVQILSWIKGGLQNPAPVHVLDRPMMLVCGICPKEKEA